MKNAGLLRYGAWQLWDYLRDKGVATMIVISLFASLSLMAIRASAPGRTLANADPAILRAAFASQLATFCVLGTLFAVNGIVANDRKMGYHRFLFAKPVTIPAYYAQAFVLHGIGVLVIAYVLAALYAVIAIPVFPPAMPIAVVAAYLGIGGIGFLFSTFWRFDWLSTLAVFAVAGFLRSFYREDTGILGNLVKLLPPADRMDEVMRAAGMGTPIPTGDAIHFAAYGIVCFALGLLHLRTRSFTVT